MYSIICFSPTGNAQHLADILARKLKPEGVVSQALEFTDPKNIQPNKHLVLIHPVHGFNAPRTVKRFVRNLPPGLFDVVSIIGVGCNTGWVNGAVSTDLRKNLIKKGYEIALDEIMAMPLTFIMNFPDELNLKLIYEAEEKIETISNGLIARTISARKVQTRSHIMNFIGKAESPAARMFGLELYANKNCTSCGTCWNNCPEKNIRRKENGKPGFGFSCSMCMRCIYNCPEKAISPRISKFLPIKNGYTLTKYVKE